MTLPDQPPLPSAATTAAGWLALGHQYAAQPNRSALESALACFDRARALALSDRNSPPDWREVGLAWMNRGNVLQQLSGDLNLVAALSAYDAALTAFAAVTHEPSMVGTIAATHLNRSRVLQAHGEFSAAQRGYESVLQLLSNTPFLDEINVAYTAAGAAINLGQIRIHQKDVSAELITQLATARSWIEPDSHDEVIAATLTLESARLELIARFESLSADSLGPFTDLIESALGLAASWQDRAHPTARESAQILFRLGAKAYAQFQPQFFIDFLRDYLDPSVGSAPFADDPAIRQIAAVERDELMARLALPRVLQLDDFASHQIAALHHELTASRSWLRPPITDFQDSS